MRNRESGIDLYRCLGLLFVTGLHSFLYNGFYSEVQGLSMLGPNMARWLFSACNGMFMLMTGYLKTRKSWDRGYYRGLWTVLVGYGLTCLISYPIRHFLYGEEHSLLDWIDRLFTFDGYGWYIGMYVGLILLSPVLNLAMDHMDRRQLLGLALTMAALTALPSATPIHLLPEYWTGLYPLTYYTLGAVIRRLELHIPSWIGLLGAALTAGLMGLLSSLTAAGGVFTDGFVQGGNGGFLSTILVTMLFLGTYRLRLPGGLERLLAWLSGGVFEGYLLSRLLDVWVYDLLPQWHTPGCYPLLFICVTIPVFLCSILTGKAVHTLAARLTK